MNFDISPHSPTPIYRQIADQVRRMVASGQLAPGAILPSVRAVALQHAINPMTVSKAYSLLESAGMLVRLRGVGMAIADGGAAVPEQDKAAMLRPALENAARMAHQLGLAPAAALELFQQCLDQPSENHHDD